MIQTINVLRIHATKGSKNGNLLNCFILMHLIIGVYFFINMSADSKENFNQLSRSKAVGPGKYK